MEIKMYVWSEVLNQGYISLSRDAGGGGRERERERPEGFYKVENSHLWGNFFFFPSKRFLFHKILNFSRKKLKCISSKMPLILPAIFSAENNERESHLKWFGHIKHRPFNDLIRRVDVLDLTNRMKGSDRPKNILDIMKKKNSYNQSHVVG
ncbi:hypothetical protein IEQ34_019965 [Dendrobium chrysotoxum]|uniref:Uncharacterized protein n=1 Tax=Dendrobium chrysotoxum TaxID=161865 RepID=A0AAV7G8F0_DENCH|nr:hypothetical protein IEQ34_019965 [Dendrobium chrysotoxum]